jgi:hypothetical protein
MRRCCVKQKNKPKRLAHTAPPLAPCHPHEAAFCPFHRLRPFVPLAREVKKQTAGDGRKGKTMKLEEINNKTNEALSFLVAALESGEVRC